MKLKAIIIFCFVLILAVACQVMLLNTFPSMSDPYGDEWYIDVVDQFAIDYLRKKENIKEEMHVVEYYYTAYDKNIEIQNRDIEEKKFPFSGIDLTVTTSTQKYKVYVLVDEFGELQVEKYEKTRIRGS